MNSVSNTDKAHFNQPDLLANFLGHSPLWYKLTMIGFLIINPVLLWLLGDMGSMLVAWLLIGQFIFTLAMALKCYPLQPGGLLAIEAVAMGLTSAESVYREALQNFPVILLLIFMVAGIYFMKDLLLLVFTRLLLGIKSKVIISLCFTVVAALLSAFLDALTVTAVLITVAVGFYNIYHRTVSDAHSHQQEWVDHHRQDLAKLSAFLRSLLMHGAVGTVLGGVMTMVGEPQNLLIAEQVGWGFSEFFVRMAPVTVPIFFAGVLTTIVLEKTKVLGYGEKIPASVLKILTDFNTKQSAQLSSRGKLKLVVQAVVAIFLAIALATHMAEVGLIGLAVIVLLTAFNGITEEHQIGKAFEEALPFTALLMVFFTIVAVIHTQALFTPIIQWLLSQDIALQPGLFFAANGLLSALSDNVFVATVYIGEVKQAFDQGLITREHFERLTIAINAGTNLPSIATPNGQAAFLFLLTSAIAPLIHLSYGRMVIMALPYTLVLSVLGFIAVEYFI